MWATTEESIPSLALASVCTCLHTHSHTQHTNTQKGGKEKNFWKNKMIDDGTSETLVRHLLLTNIQSRAGGRGVVSISLKEKREYQQILSTKITTQARKYHKHKSLAV